MAYVRRQCSPQIYNESKTKNSPCRIFLNIRSFSSCRRWLQQLSLLSHSITWAAAVDKVGCCLRIILMSHTVTPYELDMQNSVVLYPNSPRKSFVNFDIHEFANWEPCSESGIQSYAYRQNKPLHSSIPFVSCVSYAKLWIVNVFDVNV